MQKCIVVFYCNLPGKENALLKYELKFMELNNPKKKNHSFVTFIEINYLCAKLVF